MANPLAEEQSLMRTTMYPAMLSALRTNVNRRRRGFSSSRSAERSPTDAVTSGIEPARRHAGSGNTGAGRRMSGVGEGGTWYAPERRYDFYDAKAPLRLWHVCTLMA